MSAYYKVFKKYTYIYINCNKTSQYCNTVDMERFDGLNICSFSSIGQYTSNIVTPRW